MRTRRSVRNQNVLFKALFKPPTISQKETMRTACFNCISYPAHGRNRGECILIGKVVNGNNLDRLCFVVSKGGSR
jgi:hypothetical protein